MEPSAALRRVTSDPSLIENWVAVPRNPAEEQTPQGIDVLPDELLLMIFQNLDAKSLARVGSACRRIRLITQDGKLARIHAEISKLRIKANIARRHYLVRPPQNREMHTFAKLKNLRDRRGKGLIIIDGPKILLRPHFSQADLEGFHVSFKRVPEHLVIPNNTLAIKDGEKTLYTINIDTASPLVTMWADGKSICVLDRAGGEFVVDFAVLAAKQSSWYDSLIQRVMSIAPFCNGR